MVRKYEGIDPTGYLCAILPVDEINSVFRFKIYTGEDGAIDRMQSDCLTRWNECYPTPGEQDFVSHNLETNFAASNGNDPYLVYRRSFLARRYEVITCKYWSTVRPHEATVCRVMSKCR
ncbi:hypothetical protein GCM10027033_29680 [Leucobacter ruminantium]